MQKKINFFLTLLILSTAAIACGSNPNDPNLRQEKLMKTWQDEDTNYGISKYVISENSFDNLFDGQLSYSFSIEYIDWIDDTKGIIYGKYKKSYNDKDIGRYYAVSFSNLMSDSIFISGAYKSNGIYSASTLPEAKIIFTEKNGYFDFYSHCKAVK